MKIESYQGRMSSLAGQRNVMPKLALAFSAVADLDSTLGTLDALRSAAQSTRPRLLRGAVTLDAHNALAATGALPDDLLERYEEVVTAEWAYTAAESELNELYRALVDDRDMRIEGGFEDMCAALHKDLLRVYGELREMRDVPTSPEQAIASGHAAQWQKKTTLRNEYRAIREAHRAILTYGWSHLAAVDFAEISKAWPIIALASGLGAVWPDLPEWRKYGRTQKAGGRLVKLTPPWPDLTGDEGLDWLLEHPEARPWVPDLNQMGELLNQITTAAQTFYDGTRGPDPDMVNAELEARRDRWGMPAHVVY